MEMSRLDQNVSETWDKLRTCTQQDIESLHVTVADALASLGDVLPFLRCGSPPQPLSLFRGV